MILIFKRHVRFVNSKFKGHSEHAHFLKLIEEMKELEKTILDSSPEEKHKELADVILVCFSYADSIGLNYRQLKRQMKRKVVINKNRNWIKQPDGTFKHI